MAATSIGRGRRGDKVDPYLLYLRECNRVALLTAQEEKALARRARAGDKDAEHHMILANLRLVASIAKSFGGRGVELADLICEGNVGLIEAVRRFDPEYGVKFSTYASYWIKQVIRKFVRERGSAIRAPSYTFDLIVKYRDAAARRSDSGEPATAEAIAADLGISERRIRCVESAERAFNIVSLDREREKAIRNDRPDRFEPVFDGPAPDALIENANQVERDRARIDEVLGRLTDNQAKVIRMRFGIGGPCSNLSEIGKAIGVSKERVRQIQSKAIAAMRYYMRDDPNPAGDS